MFSGWRGNVTREPGSGELSEVEGVDLITLQELVNPLKKKSNPERP